MLTYAWTGIAAIALPFCLYVAADAYRDVQARKMSGLNHGREMLARLLVVTSSLTAAAFFIWICLGIYQLFLREWTPDPWKTTITPAGLVLSELVLAGAMIYKQQIRRRVLVEDMASEQTRAAAAAALASTERRDLTEATRELTTATQEQTAALHNGPMAAQLDNTRATDELKDSTDELKESTDAATLVVKTQIELRKLDGESDG